MPFPSPGDLLELRIEPGSPALQADSLPSEPPGKPREGGNGVIRTNWTEPEEGTNWADLGTEEGPVGFRPGWAST